MGKFAIGSEGIIGNVKNHYQSLKHKGWEWHSFYNGWIEGRAELSSEIREGKYAETSANGLHKHSVMPSLPDGLDDDSNCDHNFKLGWIACWKALTGNEA